MDIKEENKMEQEVEIYLEEGIDYNANTILLADEGDVKQLAYDSFWKGWVKAMEYYKSTQSTSKTTR